MSLSVIANRSHSGFRAAVYGIHFDPWDFDTLLYFVKTVAFFALMVVESLLFLSMRRSFPAKDCPTLTFFLLQGFHPPPLARPFSKGLLASDYLTFAFTPLRRIGFKQSQTFLDDVFYVLPHVFEVVLDVEV